MSIPDSHAAIEGFWSDHLSANALLQVAAADRLRAKADYLLAQGSALLQKERSRRLREATSTSVREIDAIQAEEDWQDLQFEAEWKSKLLEAAEIQARIAEKRSKRATNALDAATGRLGQEGLDWYTGFRSRVSPDPIS